MAVYTDISDEALECFLADYAIGPPLAFKGIAEGVENSNYFLATEHGRYILTIYERRVAETDLPFFLRLMDHLASKGFACPTPVHARDGAALRRLANKPAAIVTFVDGMSLTRPRPDQCHDLGRTLASLHDAGLDFPMKRKNALGPQAWSALWAGLRTKADTLSPGLANEIDAAINAVADWPKDLPTGVIHADLFPDNVFFLEGKVTACIDFYFACTDLLAYDIAVCLNAWCFETDGSYNLTKGQALIAGYNGVRPITPDERAALPLLARGAALRFFLTRLADWGPVAPGALVRPKDPMEYARKLAFHARSRGTADYGFAPTPANR
jgi:homoserine kinase type II